MPNRHIHCLQPAAYLRTGNLTFAQILRFIQFSPTRQTDLSLGLSHHVLENHVHTCIRQLPSVC